MKYVPYAAKAALTHAGGYVGGQLAKAGYGYVSRKFGGRRRSLGRRARRGGRAGTLTLQRDMTTSKGGKRRNKSFERFRRKVQLALQMDQPRMIYQSFLKNNLSDSTPTGEYYISGTFLGDTNTTTQGDLYNVFKDAYGLSSVTEAEAKKIRLLSMHSTMIIRNEHASQTLYLDVFTCLARDDIDLDETFAQQMATYFADMTDVGSTSEFKLGTTPYMIPNFVRNWKILKKQSFRIEAGDSVKIHLHRKVNRYIDGRDLQDNYMLKKITAGFLLQGHGDAVNSAATSGLGAWNISWTMANAYEYREVTSSEVNDTIGQSK